MTGRAAPALAGCLLAGFTVSVLLGQDANWDLRNYHLYNPWALLTGRLDLDLLPAGVQSLFNPLLDVPYYLLSHDLLADRPRLVAGLAGLPYGMLIFLTWRIARRVLGPGWPAMLATGIGVTGTTIVGEIGTTFGDIPTADLMLGALLCVLAGTRARDGLKLCAMAGLLAGAAVGLKPTNAALAPALLLALLSQPGQPWRGGLAFVAGGLIGTGLTWGWWGVHLARLYGNPVAPYLNQVFRSPWFPTGGNTDRGFLPRDPLQALAYPFFWLRGETFVVSETKFRDARFAAGEIAFAACVLAAVRALRPPPPPAVAVLIFAGAGFVFWEAAFSIIRYAVALESLTGCVILLGLRQWQRSRLSRVVGGAAIVLVLGYGNDAGWGRVRGFRATVLATTQQALPAHSLVVVDGAPYAFLALFLQGADARFIGTSGMAAGTRMWAEAERRIAAHAGPLFLLGHAGETTAPAIAWGLRPAAACLPLPNPYQRDLVLCPAMRTGPA